MWWRYIQKEKRTMAVMPMMGTSEYMSVVNTGGFWVTGLEVAGGEMKRHRDGERERERGEQRSMKATTLTWDSTGKEITRRWKMRGDF